MRVKPGGDVYVCAYHHHPTHHEDEGDDGRPAVRPSDDEHGISYKRPRIDFLFFFSLPVFFSFYSVW